MNSSLIVEKFDEWRARSQPIALVTVYETLGSTYSKPGHRILIAEGGDYQGLVSGGCLEGDLAEHAAKAIAADEARVLTYDLRDDADELFGLGVGCDGLLRVLVQPMTAAGDYAPFRQIAAAMLGSEPAAVATVIAPGESAGVPGPGATLIRAGRDLSLHGVPVELVPAIAALCDAAIDTNATTLTALADGTSVLVGPLARVPRLLVLGAGIDAVPLVSMAAQLGWRVHVADHRPAYLERAAFRVASAATLVVPGRLAGALPLADFDAIVVMSHHLLTDEAYLRELRQIACRYVGVLGPAARRTKLLSAIGEIGGPFAQALRGPVGLDLGADSPETIALSILAEIQLTLGSARAGAVAQPRQ